MDESDDAPDSLDALRERIDRLDAEIVERLNARARVVVSIGEYKRRTVAATYVPSREAQVLARIRALNEGPLSDHAIESIYRELMSASFALEHPLRVGFLGPSGTFSDLAARAHFGASVEYVPRPTIAAVFEAVAREDVDHALVPVENSLGGGITETLDAFLSGPRAVRVCAELRLGVHHHVLGPSTPSEIRRVHSKPEVFRQCARWLQTHLPHAELVAEPSTAHAAQRVRAAVDAGADDVVALASSAAAERHGLRLLYERIEDDPNNLTRFLVLGRDQADRTGDDKSALAIRTRTGPGQLARVLQAFADHDVDLTHIDKRPSGREPFDYAFFVELVGHVDDAPVAGALAQAREACLELRVLGSYPRAQRVV
jgi:chorismate mutase/prephenate dehydratase